MEETHYRQQTQERYRSVSAGIQDVVQRQSTARNVNTCCPCHLTVCLSAFVKVTLIAVSKTHPSAAVQAVYDAGHKDFGENYVSHRECVVWHATQ